MTEHFAIIFSRKAPFHRRVGLGLDFYKFDLPDNSKLIAIGYIKKDYYPKESGWTKGYKLYLLTTVRSMSI